VEECRSEPNMGLLGDAAGMCGCLYDELAGDVSFAEFNQEWTAEDIDPASTTAAAINAATAACVGAAGGG
jgi:hypothetical protein